jgi:sulfate adenylyltransferase subunit 2
MLELKDLENQTLYILREAYAEFKRPAVLWSMGKDSTTMLWLCRKAFFGEIPFPVIHIDTGYKFKQMYDFRSRLSKEWNLDLQVARNEEALRAGVSPSTEDKLECCTKLKTEALRNYLEANGFDALILAIRRDEHGIRAKERYFSPRNEDFRWDYKDQPLEMWDQFQGLIREGSHIPVNPMYFAKNGKRYRSLGCEPCTQPIDSNAETIADIVEELRTTKIAERSGRAQDKEKSFTMQKLRALGYM